MIEQARNNNAAIPTPEQLAGRFLILQLIHLALVLGVVLFGGVVLFLKHGALWGAPSFADPMYTAAALLCAGTLLGAGFIRPSCGGIGVPPGLETALRRYQACFLIRAGLVESGALFAAVVTFLRPNVVPLILFVISAATLAIRRPSPAEFAALCTAPRRREHF